MSMIRNLYNNSALQGGFATTPYAQNPDYDKIGKSIWNQMQFTPRQLKAMQDFNARYGTVMGDWEAALGALYVLDSWALMAKRLRSQLSFDKFLQSRGKTPKYSTAERTNMSLRYKHLMEGLIRIRDTLHNQRVNKLPFYTIYLKIRKYSRKAHGLSKAERDYLYDEKAPYTRHTALTWLSYPPYKAQYDALVSRLGRKKPSTKAASTLAEIVNTPKALETLENSVFNQSLQPEMSEEAAVTQSTQEKRKARQKKREQGFTPVTQTTDKPKKTGRKKMPKIPVYEEALPPLPDVPNLFQETPSVNSVTPEQLAAINQMPESGDIPAMPAALGAIAEDQAAAQALQDAEDEVHELLDKDADDEY